MTLVTVFSHSRASIISRHSKIWLTRRHLHIALGILWLIDGALQAQPYMFTRAFAKSYIGGAAMGQPGFISGPLHLVESIMVSHPELNGVILVAQLAIGVGFFIRKTTKISLLASIFWSIGVWYVGDGLGGIFTGNGTMLSGFPTAPILYCLISVALWPRSSEEFPTSSSSSLLAVAISKLDRVFRLISRSFSSYIWAVVWIGSAIFQLFPSQLSSNAVSDVIKQSASSSPDWLASLDQRVITMLHGFGIETAIALVVSQLLVGGSIFFKASEKFAIILGTLVSALYWIFGQSMGALTTGQSTDVNTAPLVILLGLVIAYHSKKANQKQVLANVITEFEKERESSNRLSKSGQLV